MKTYLRQESTVAGVVVNDIVDAGHLGYTFAKQYPDLTKNGWVLYYHGSEEELLSAAGGRLIFEIEDSVEALAGLIKNTCPACGQQRPQL